MSKLKEEIISLLKYYVERESEGEKRLIEEQENCGLKVFLSVHYSRKNDRDDSKNIITIHTKLNQISENKETHENLDQFYIKSQKVTHHTRTSSEHKYYNGDVISIETIVTKPYFQCESVFKTLIMRTDNGKRQQTQRSFTREVLKCDQVNHQKLHNCLSKPSNGEDSSNLYPTNGLKWNEVNENKKFTKLKKKISFKSQKPSLVKKEVDISNKSSNLVVNLEPIKKPKKSIKRRLKEWLDRSNIVPSEQNITPNRKKSIVELKKCISTEESEMEKEKPTNIMARISTGTETKVFEIIKDDLQFIDENGEENELNVAENQDQFISLSESFSNFSFPYQQEFYSKKLVSVENCTCVQRKIETLFKFITSKLDKKAIDEKEIEKFDDESGHFIDCHSYLDSHSTRKVIHKTSSTATPNSLNLPLRTDMPRSRRRSILSLHSECHLDTVFDNFKFLNEIHCPKETINYFIESKIYESYEKGLQKVLDTKISLENMTLFFYFIRLIVKQIDDPTNEENDDIKRIMQFSEKFLIKYYYDEISKHGDLERFILHSDSVD